MQMTGLWARLDLVLKLLPETGRAMVARLLQESTTLKPGCQIESQHCFWTLFLLGTWLVTNGSGCKQHPHCVQDCAQNSGDGNVP